VIGNPPYVRQEMLDVSEKKYLEKYSVFTGRSDLYVFFVEKALNILKKSGLFSFIMPNKWMQAEYGIPLRDFLLSKRILKIIDFGDNQIFEGATTYPCICIAENNVPDKTFQALTIKNSSSIEDFKNNLNNDFQSFDTGKLRHGAWVISSQSDSILLEKLKTSHKTLEEIINGEAYYGIKPGLTKAFIIDEETRNYIIKKDSF